MKKIGFPLVFYVLFMLPVISAGVSEEHTITWSGGGEGQVRFEGYEHGEKGYMCDTCHPAIFKMKRGGNPITMAAMAKGRFCGACHNGREAFAAANPKNCHECHKAEERHKHKHKEHEDEDEDDD